MSVALAVLFALAAEPSGPRVFDWNVPKLVANARVGSGRIEALGMPLDMHVVRSEWKPSDLAIHYARRFLDAGFFVPPNQRPLPGTVLPRITALDPLTMWTYTIIFYAEPDGTTTMLLGAADLGHRKPTEVERFPAPVFPAASGPATFELETAHALTFSTAAAEGEVIGFYRQTLTAAGWREPDDRRGTFTKNGRSIRVLAKPDGKKLGVVVLEDADREAANESSAAPSSR